MKTLIKFDPREEFTQYVESFDNKERHTPEACQAVDQFSSDIENIDTTQPDDYQQQSRLYNSMMNAAVEFEESGFIAGMRWAFDIVGRAFSDIAIQEKRPGDMGRE